MKSHLAFVLVVLGQMTLALAQAPAPRLLGVPTPGGEASPAPELLVLQGISDDGRRLLFTSSSDRLVTNDHNAALDVFLFDRVTATFRVISSAPDGRSGNDSSLGGSLSADAGLIAFQSRASDLATGDANSTWDVFAHDLARETNHLVSIATNGLAGRTASMNPRISADGRYVLFRSTATDLVPLATTAIEALFRRDLDLSKTVLVSSNLTGLGASPPRIGDAWLTPDGRFATFIGVGQSNQVFVRDIEDARTVRVSQSHPTGFPASIALSYSRPVSSHDGASAACRVTFGRTNGFIHYAVSPPVATAFGVSTNPLPTSVDTTLLGPEMSGDGRFIAFAQAMAMPGSTNVTLQVFRRNVLEQTTTLISSAPGAGAPPAPGSGHSWAPRISPDGRFIAFLSYATNLVAGAMEPILRGYWWDADIGTLQVIAQPGSSAPSTALVASRNGAWVAVFGQDSSGPVTAQVFEAAAGQTTEISLTPAVPESSTARGGLSVQPSGVSQDGRYVALLSFPPTAPAGTGPGQVVLLDTGTGTRSLVTIGLDNQPASANCTTPSISADGARVAYASDATNLVPGDVNTFRDAFVSQIANVLHRVIRPPNLPGTVRHAGPEALLSPDGRYLLFTLEEAGKFLPRLADLQSGAISAALPGVPFGQASFSQDGLQLVGALSTLPSTTTPTVKVIDVPAWIATGAPAAMLWTGPAKSSDPVINLAGSRVAFWVSGTGQNTIRVVDWAQDQSVFAHDLGTATPSNLALSGDGRYLVWVNSSSIEHPMPQAWRADLQDQSIALVSVAPDGTTPGNHTTRHAAVSANGRYVAFASLADNLVAGDQNGTKDVFLRDMQTLQTLLVSRTPAGAAGDGRSTRPFFSPDGRSLFFLSYAPDLALADRNQGVDLYKVEILESPAGPLLVLERNLGTGEARLLWTGQPGQQYEVEFKDDLSLAAWNRLPGTYTDSAPIDLDPAPGSRRFYRIVEAESR